MHRIDHRAGAVVVPPVPLQPPLPLQEFLPLQPLSLDLQPPWPLQSFLPLQVLLPAASSRLAALWPARVVASVEREALRLAETAALVPVLARTALVPANKPATAAAAIMDVV